MFSGGNGTGTGRLSFVYIVSANFCICVGRKLETLGESSILPFSGTGGITQRVNMRGMQDREACPAFASTGGQHRGQAGAWPGGQGWAALSFCCNY